MATVDVVAMGGGKTGSVELDASVFEAPIKPHLFHAEVRRQLAARRAGTHATKNRAAVSGITIDADRDEQSQFDAKHHDQRLVPRNRL